MSEDLVSMMDLDKTVLEEGAALDVAKIHELRTPGIFKILPRYNISQNQECVIRVYYSLPDSPLRAVGHDNLGTLNAKISVLGQEIRRLNKQMDELIACRDSPLSTDAQQEKAGQLPDDVMRLSFVDVLRPLFLTIEVTCVDAVIPVSPNFVRHSDHIVSNVDELPGVSQPMPNVAALTNLLETDLPAGQKRRRSSEVEPSTPSASSGQKNEIHCEALKRAKKKKRVDVPQESKGDKDVEFDLPSQSDPQQEGDDGLDTVYESRRLQIEERVDDETMQVDADDPQVLRPDSPEWDDLEAAESDDPLLVTEYSTEIVAYLKEAEKATMPNPNYIVDQEEMTWKIRCTLMDWVVQLHHGFRGNLETLFLCVNIIDRFLSKRSIRLEKLSLLGLIAYSVAAKYEQIFAPSRLQLSDLPMGHGISGPELFNGEIQILKMLDWNISSPGPLTWLRRGSKADDYEIQARTVAKYLMEVGCVEHRMLGFVPSLVAATSLWLARLSLGRLEWTATLVHYTTYTENELIPVAEIILEHIMLSPSPAEYVHAEYRKKIHFRASIHFKAWTVMRWEENTKIDLERDLPLVKAGKLKDGILSSKKDEVEMEGVSQGSQG